MNDLLRGAVLLFATLMVVLGIFGVFAEGSSWPFLFVAVVILVGVVFERRRYGGATAVPPDGDGWAPTAERFVDEQGVPVRVWFNARDGRRRYVADDSAPAEH